MVCEVHASPLLTRGLLHVEDECWRRLSAVIALAYARTLACIGEARVSVRGFCRLGRLRRRRRGLFRVCGSASVFRTLRRTSAGFRPGSFALKNPLPTP